MAVLCLHGRTSRSLGTQYKQIIEERGGCLYWTMIVASDSLLSSSHVYNGSTADHPGA